MKAEMPKQGRKDRDNENRVLFGLRLDAGLNKIGKRFLRLTENENKIN